MIASTKKKLQKKRYAYNDLKKNEILIKYNEIQSMKIITEKFASIIRNEFSAIKLLRLDFKLNVFIGKKSVDFASKLIASIEFYATLRREKNDKEN